MKTIEVPINNIGLDDLDRMEVAPTISSIREDIATLRGEIMEKEQELMDLEHKLCEMLSVELGSLTNEIK